jgi:hypothetical protein
VTEVAAKAGVAAVAEGTARTVAASVDPTVNDALAARIVRDSLDGGVPQIAHRPAGESRSLPHFWQDTI